MGLDANTQLGLDSNFNQWEDECIGDYNLGKPTPIGQTWERWFRSTGATSAGTFFKTTSASYFPIEDDRTPTYIDHLIIPQKLAEHHATKSATAKMTGRLLQIIPDSRPRDHIPQILSFPYTFPCSKESQQQTFRWDYDALGKCLQKGINKDEFTTDLEQAFTDCKESIHESFQDTHTANTHGKPG